VVHGTDHDLAHRDAALGLTLQQADAVIRRAGPRAAEQMVERILAHRILANAVAGPRTAPDAESPRRERRAYPRTVTVTGVR
jgi:hypothetical protein